MLLGIISDIHANLPALEAVINSLKALRPDGIYCAGDIVGYNPFPNEVIETVMNAGIHSILGNHDRATLDGDLSWFSENAARALEWTRDVITDASAGYLLTLKAREELKFGKCRILMVHGSPKDDDEYVPAMDAKYWPFKDLDVDVLIMGHTHQQWTDRFGRLVALNPGSVGQPRDRNPRAGYATLDTDTLEVRLFRVEYDIERTAIAVRDAKLPSQLALRLYNGE
jgi:putative phosphoesterase